MTTFHGGPADGVTLMFSRAPRFVRVVEDADGGFDVLDQPDDVPRLDEQVYVYRLRGTAAMAHINNRGSRSGPRSGMYAFGDYDHVELPDEVRVQLRDMVAWRSWAMRQEVPGE